MMNQANFLGVTANIGRQDIFYLDTGVGFPVLFLHGLAGDHTAWKPQIDQLKNGFRILAPDTRGAGKSTQRDEPVTVHELAEDFIGLLEKLDIRRCHVVGRSLGGAIGQVIAVRRPQLVQSLVLIASGAKLDPLGVRCMENMLDALSWRNSWMDWSRHSVPYFVSPKFYNENPEKILHIESLMASTAAKPACYVRTNDAAREFDFLVELSNIRCPTLVMSGGLDPICGPIATKWMIDRLPQGQWDEFKNSSHFFLMEEPERFMKALRGWLDEHTPLRSAIDPG
ncbi:alpha/beta fold hydrolase [Bradyrhizobium sp. CCBAU 45321]|uniref:alpha/beta fold hydrolase n=1 Tax=Bradyrhizobium sp. CCBAU 45321 TaxID=1641878 RepID=UPI0023044655|nr:alpha/beta hydrolase [Bradyrhizobium sp. CCBAU 45321]